MNGIIIHRKTAGVGCPTEFLFEPEISSDPIQAIAEFSSGEKAYAELLRAAPSEVRIHIGEYLNGKGKKISETFWQLFYNKTIESWQISKNITAFS
jgi:hypothetical protein